MKLLLKTVFACFLAAILAATAAASLDRNVLEAAKALWPDPWFRATLVDTYCAFFTIYLWMAYKERSWPARGMWLAAVVFLGTFAFSAYILIQLFKLKPGDPLSKLLLRS